MTGIRKTRRQQVSCNHWPRILGLAAVVVFLLSLNCAGEKPLKVDKKTTLHRVYVAEPLFDESSLSTLYIYLDSSHDAVSREALNDFKNILTIVGKAIRQDMGRHNLDVLNQSEAFDTDNLLTSDALCHSENVAGEGIKRLVSHGRPIQLPDDAGILTVAFCSEHWADHAIAFNGKRMKAIAMINTWSSTNNKPSKIWLASSDFCLYANEAVDIGRSAESQHRHNVNDLARCSRDTISSIFEELPAAR